MPLTATRAARRGLVACALVTLCLGPALPTARAQEAPAIASGGETVLLRDQPGWEAAVLVAGGRWQRGRDRR